jgi:uncharacterized protein (DUF488 family)
MTDSLTLYTIGHSNLAKEEFLAHLRQHHITVLVDVRSAPVSRFVPHFNKKALEAYLKENGIDYRYAGEYLGGRPKDESVYKAQSLPDKKPKGKDFMQLVDYEATMKTDWYQTGIRRLLDIIAETKVGNVAIMCSEGSPLDCHRHHLIARSLLDPAVKMVEPEIQIRHITKEGNTETVDASLFEAQSHSSDQRRLL